ncbi:hypothetical protein GFS60_07003 (plasmid) [Rhodococcus sp. WAY2]|nr:hypothetical protein GFS60_07003 [Rhodococcus sp. WAY2]
MLLSPRFLGVCRCAGTAHAHLLDAPDRRKVPAEHHIFRSPSPMSVRVA